MTSYAYPTLVKNTQLLYVGSLAGNKVTTTVAAELIALAFLRGNQYTSQFGLYQFTARREMFDANGQFDGWEFDVTYWENNEYLISHKYELTVWVHDNGIPEITNTVTVEEETINTHLW